jgi:hypothetical protein
MLALIMRFKAVTTGGDLPHRAKSRAPARFDQFTEP